MGVREFELLDKLLCMILPTEKDISTIMKSHTNDSDQCYVAGIDEAGRGPVLGPMVYALAWAKYSDMDKIKNLKVADSKTLTPEARSILFNDMLNNKIIGWTTRILDPNEISNKMFKRTKINLNTISHQAIVFMIQTILNKDINLSKIWVDTVGPSETLQKYLSSMFPMTTFIVSKKADSLYPMVSAASIIAKVIRDEHLHKWNFVEKHCQDIDREFGSGYPADPITVSWMKRHCDSIFGYPRLIRFSWSTAENAINNNHAISVIWESQSEQNDLKRKRKETKSSILKHFSIPKSDNGLLEKFGIHQCKPSK